MVLRLIVASILMGLVVRYQGLERQFLNGVESNVGIDTHLRDVLPAIALIDARYRVVVFEDTRIFVPAAVRVGNRFCGVVDQRLTIAVGIEAATV